MKNKNSAQRVSIATRLPQKTTLSKDVEFESIMKWASRVSEHPHLYYPANQMISHYHFYKVQFLEVSDIDVLLAKRKQYLQITCIIFNKRTQAFIGSTYSSDIFDIQAKRQEKPAAYCQKSIFFYTQLEDIVLKVDVWRLQSDKNPKGIQNMNKRVYLGGLQVGLGQTMQSGTIEKVLNDNQTSRFQLSSIEEVNRTQQSQQNSKKKPCKLIYRVMNTHSLSHLHHFIPSNHIFDNHHSIIGLKDNKIGDDGSIQMGDRNRLHFEIKTISIPVNIGKYLTQISQQKINASFEMNGRANVLIKQVRFNFEFHNGWKSVCSQSLVLKEMNQQSIINDTNKSVMPSRMQLNKKSKFNEPVIKNKVYTFEKPKELKAVFMGEGGVLLLWLEAKMQCKFDVLDSNNNKKTKTENFYLPIGFALKAISPNQEEFELNLELYQGNVYNLSSLVTYFSQLKQQQKGKQQKILDASEKIICNISLLLKKSGGTIENIQTVQKDMNEIQELKNQKERLARLKRKVKEQKRKKLIELNQQIPFLDTIQLKEQLYQEKITRIKNEKLEQEEILSFLKLRLNQLQRQTLKNQLNYNESQDDEQDETKGIKMKKLPQNFVDYRPQPQVVSINDSIVINNFPSSYCKMAMTPSRLVSPELVHQCTNSQTYIQFKISTLQVHHESIESLVMLVPNFQGGFQRLPLNSKDFQNKSVEIKISYDKEKTESILNKLLNGYFTILMELSNNKKLQASSTITISQLIEKCDSGDLLQSIEKSYTFESENTLIAFVTLSIAFTNTSNTLRQGPIESKIKPIENQSGMFSIQNRINRFKQLKGQDCKKRQLVSDIISNFNVNKITLHHKQLNSQKVSLKFKNSSQERQQYFIKIFDEDSIYITKDEITLSKIIDLVQSQQISISQKSKTFQLERGTQCQIILVYSSPRMNMSLGYLEDSQHFHFDNSFYKDYNHQHKISINITQTKTSIILSRHEINVVPQYEFNSYFIERFLTKDQIVTFPIITTNLALTAAKKDVTQSSSKLQLSIPKLKNSDLHISQFLLTKNSPQGNITFQNFVFYGWGCQRLDTEGRLWQKKDILIKIPLQVILSQEVGLSQLIDTITATSRHASLKIRQAGEFMHQSTVNINRKSSEILLRGQLFLDSIGKCTYGIQIADKNMKVFYRIGVCVNVEFPTLAAHQIIAIKVPNDRLEDPEPFAFKNKQEIGLQYQLKCYRPYLLRFVEKKSFLKVDQEWKIEMLFNWRRIVNEMLEQEKDETSILIGIKSRLTIEYLLFKIRVN